jgi:hypothetical protein
MDKTPIIRLELERMKHSVIHALVDYNDKLEGIITAEIEKAIEDFNLEVYIRKEVDASIKQMVTGALLREMGWQVQDEIAKEVTKALAKKLNGTETKQD